MLHLKAQREGLGNGLTPQQKKFWDLKIFLPHLVILQVKKLSYREANYLAKVTQLLKHLEAQE